MGFLVALLLPAQLACQFSGVARADQPWYTQTLLFLPVFVWNEFTIDVNARTHDRNRGAQGHRIFARTRHAHGHITAKDRLMEKTPGVDDVYLIAMDHDTRIQVDSPIYSEVALDQLVRKEAWSRKIDIDGTMIDLDWSRDFKAMLWAMPSIVILFLVIGFLIIRT